MHCQDQVQQDTSGPFVPNLGPYPDSSPDRVPCTGIELLLYAYRTLLESSCKLSSIFIIKNFRVGWLALTGVGALSRPTSSFLAPMTRWSRCGTFGRSGLRSMTSRDTRTVSFVATGASPSSSSAAAPTMTWRSSAAARSRHSNASLVNGFNGKWFCYDK